MVYPATNATIWPCGCPAMQLFLLCWPFMRFKMSHLSTILDNHWYSLRLSPKSPEFKAQLWKVFFIFSHVNGKFKKYKKVS